jgi:hypothetical protein
MSPEPHNPLVTVDAAAIFDQVSSRIRQEVLLPERGAAVRLYSGPARSAVTLEAADIFAETALRLQALQESINGELESAIARIGAAPPTATTLRGRFGAAAIAALQRVLWWYTRSLHPFAGSTASHLQAQLETLKCMACAQETMRAELAALRDEVRSLSAEAAERAGEDH